MLPVMNNTNQGSSAGTRAGGRCAVEVAAITGPCARGIEHYETLAAVKARIAELDAQYGLPGRHGYSWVVVYK